MKKICFTVMPFGYGDEYDGKKEEADFVYHEIIKPAVHAAVSQFKSQFGDRLEHDLEVLRELDDVGSGAITSSIVRHIADSHITIVDLTGRNPNVFLELGIRFALRRNGTILLVQDTKQLPFNVAAFRVVQYCPRFSGIERAKNDLTGTILKTLRALAQPTLPTTDSLVFDALPSLKISGLGFTEESPTFGRVSWEEYWSRVVHIEEVLSELHATGVYRPDLIVGISNGGLFLADTCLRLVYKNDVPLVGLWAQRSKDQYFDNPVNNALVDQDVILQLVSSDKPRPTKLAGSAIGQTDPGPGRSDDGHSPITSAEPRPIRLLVMDDIVGTQRTFDQLVDYMKERLGDFFSRIEVRFIFLFTPRLETVTALQPYLLSHDQRIARTYKPVELEAVTGKSELPYRKSIHYGSITKPDNEVLASEKPRRVVSKVEIPQAPHDPTPSFGDEANQDPE